MGKLIVMILLGGECSAPAAAGLYEYTAPT